MRISNVFGAFIALFLAIMLDWATIGTVYTFINGQMTGDAQTLAFIGMAIVYTIITIGVPILIAIEDTTTDTA